MTETDTNQTVVDDAAAKAFDEDTRRIARVQMEVADAHNMEVSEKNLNRLSNSDFRKVVIARHGFDPGI